MMGWNGLSDRTIHRDPLNGLIILMLGRIEINTLVAFWDPFPHGHTMSSWGFHLLDWLPNGHALAGNWAWAMGPTRNHSCAAAMAMLPWGRMAYLGPAPAVVSRLNDRRVSVAPAGVRCLRMQAASNCCLCRASTIDYYSLLLLLFLQLSLLWNPSCYCCYNYVFAVAIISFFLWFTVVIFGCCLLLLVEMAD